LFSPKEIPCRYGKSETTKKKEGTKPLQQHAISKKLTSSMNYYRSNSKWRIIPKKKCNSKPKRTGNYLEEMSHAHP